MKAYEKNIRKVEPYVPGEQPQHKVIKLNTYENPYPPAPGVAKVLREMDADRMRLYPDPTCNALVHALAEYYAEVTTYEYNGVVKGTIRITNSASFGNFCDYIGIGIWYYNY